jgi:hypothetical protein
MEPTRQAGAFAPSVAPGIDREPPGHPKGTPSAGRHQKGFHIGRRASACTRAISSAKERPSPAVGIMWPSHILILLLRALSTVGCSQRNQLRIT